MSNPAPSAAGTALQLLADVIADRENDLYQFSANPIGSQDDDNNETDSPIIGSFRFILRIWRCHRYSSYD